MSHLKHYLLTLGLPGLFLIALLDSAAVPMVGGPDAVVLLLAWQKPRLWPLVALVAALGSTAGCFVLYRIGRAGGELALARFAPEKQKKVKANIDRHAFWAVLTAVLAPPPFPTKLVIVAAGAVKVPLWRFTTGVLAGRFMRYAIGGSVGARFGDQAARVLKAHYPLISLGLIAGLILLLLLRRSRRSEASEDDQALNPD